MFFIHYKECKNCNNKNRVYQKSCLYCGSEDLSKNKINVGILILVLFVSFIIKMFFFSHLK